MARLTMRNVPLILNSIRVHLTASSCDFSICWRHSLTSEHHSPIPLNRLFITFYIIMTWDLVATLYIVAHLEFMLAHLILLIATLLFTIYLIDFPSKAAFAHSGIQSLWSLSLMVPWLLACVPPGPSLLSIPWKIIWFFKTTFYPSVLRT